MELCKTISYDFEEHKGSSITQIGESLDFRNLLARSAAGILDIGRFSLPRSADLTGGDKDLSTLEKEKSDLLNRPTSVMDNCFGASVEEAEAEMSRHQRTIRENIKQKSDPKPDPEPDPKPEPKPDPNPAPKKED